MLWNCSAKRRKGTAWNGTVVQSMAMVQQSQAARRKARAWLRENVRGSGRAKVRQALQRNSPGQHGLESITQC